ncbi:MAG TPA: ATP-binding protein [Cyclobacteriaceae bacterium]
MKLLSKVLLLSLIPVFAHAQSSQQIDSVYRILEQAANDTVRLKAYSMLGGLYDDINSDSGLYYCNKGISIAEKLDFQLNKAEMLAFMSWPLMKTGNYPEALKVINEGFKITEDPSNEKKSEHLKKGQTRQMYRLYVIGLLHGARESLFGYVGDYEKQIAAALEAIPYVEAAGDMPNLAGLYPDIGDSYIKLNKFDSAIFYLQKSLEYHSKLSFEDRKFEGSTYTSIGTIYEKTGNTDLARENYKKGIQVSELYDNPRLAGNACLQLASLYQSLKIADSSFVYAKKALDAFKQGGYNKEVAIAYRMISDYYWDKENTDSSFAYLRMATALDDNLDEIEKTKLQEFQVAAFNQQLSLQQLAQEQIEKEGRLKTIAIIALIIVFSTIGFLLYRNNRQKKKANQILQEKNNQIEQTLSDLKTTQKQLIQSEKMASLGELTAGIAHEIQNPLNFVNNFSDVNAELIDEADEELGKGNIADVKNILQGIKDNEKKINHHGKRADSIVKGMLQHSRSSNGVKEPTEINALCDEYLRLAYHGLRAKEKSFNAELKTDFDDTIGSINIIQQDIGRVILNLINNAFYAVNEKSKQSIAGYEPTVSVSTKKDVNKVLISVKDNGNGIPDSIKEKIFQPFFTTKPTGQGTGLGLSLSYDSVKAHGGEIRVESEEGKGSEFTIEIPIT